MNVMAGLAASPLLVAVDVYEMQVLVAVAKVGQGSCFRREHKLLFVAAPAELILADIKGGVERVGETAFQQVAMIRPVRIMAGVAIAGLVRAVQKFALVISNFMFAMVWPLAWVIGLSWQVKQTLVRAIEKQRFVRRGVGAVAVGAAIANGQGAVLVGGIVDVLPDLLVTVQTELLGLRLELMRKIGGVRIVAGDAVFHRRFVHHVRVVHRHAQLAVTTEAVFLSLHRREAAWRIATGAADGKACIARRRTARGRCASAGFCGMSRRFARRCRP